MALNTKTTVYGLPEASTYSRIGMIHIDATVTAVSVEIRLDTYASKAAFEAGISAIKSDSTTLTIDRAIDSSLETESDRIIGNRNPKAVQKLALSLVRKLGYLVIKELPAYSAATDTAE